jgi:L-fuculose-phosphate aldolase
MNSDIDTRQQVVVTLRALVAKGLTSGSSGNVSTRSELGMLITPTGLLPDRLQADQIVDLSLEGRPAPAQLTPSSEWRIHADIYRRHPQISAVVHCHSTYATILACAHRPIPPIHYLLAATGSFGIPLADYATFGTQALSDEVNRVLEAAPACLMANHGQLATGGNLGQALQRAELVEEVARWYWGTLAIGGPQLLTEEAMAEALEAFAGYGQQSGGGIRDPGESTGEA